MRRDGARIDSSFWGGGDQIGDQVGDPERGFGALQMSWFCGRITMSRMVTLGGRVNIQRHASATSSDRSPSRSPARRSTSAGSVTPHNSLSTVPGAIVPIRILYGAI